MPKLTFFKWLAIALTLSQSLAWAGPSERGGADGGGGNMNRSHAMTFTEIKTSIERSRYFLQRILNFQELMSEDSQYHQTMLRIYDEKAPIGKLLRSTALLSAYHKIFAGPEGQNIFAKLAQVHFKPQMHGGCLDRNHVEQDASAGVSAPDEVCMSVERLQQKLTDLTIGNRLYALAAHEVSHLLGTTEEEARALQQMIEMIVTIGNLQEMESRIEGARVKSMIYPPDMQVVRELLARRNPEDAIELCYQIRGFLHEIGWIVPDYVDSSGLLYTRLSGFRQAHAASEQSEFLAFFCQKSDGPYTTRTFARSKWKVGLTEPWSIGKYFRESMNAGGEFELTESEGLAKIGHYMNYDDAQFNFDEIEKNLKPFFKGLIHIDPWTAAVRN